MQTTQPTRTELAEHRQYLRALKGARRAAKAEGDTRTAARIQGRIRFESLALDVCSAGSRMPVARVLRRFARELCRQSAAAQEAGA